MTDQIKTITDKEHETIDKAWQELWEFAQSCIHWGDSDIDKERFIENGKKLFIVSEIET